MGVRWRLSAEEEIRDPDWPQIREALHHMDEDTLSEVSLDLAGVGRLVVGGGDGGRYLVVFFPVDHPDAPSLTLTDISLTGPNVELTVQTPADYPARMCVQLPLVLSVVEHFFHTGQLLRSVRWELDNTGMEAPVQ